VFIIDPVWRADAAQLLERAFDLSDAESEIVSSFMAGFSTKEIATQRNRSYATVRTQFQTILSKAGATNQVELMRTALSLSQFIADVEPLANAASHPTRRRADVLRPHNRSVDTLFYGDPEGEPIIYLHNMYTRTFPPVIEAELAKAGLYVIAVARPGYGQSTMPPPKQDYVDCYIEDIRAVMDQMQIDRCKILGHVTAAPFTFAACAALPERFSHAFVTSSSTPAPFVKLTSVGSNWTSALVSACKVSPKMGGLILSSGLRWTRKHGITRFLAKHHRNSPADLEISLRPDVLKDFSASYDFSCAQGFESAALGFVISTDDWSSLVEQSNIPTTLIHGEQDSHFSVQAARQFRDAYPEKINLIEFEDAGQLVMLSHTRQVLQILLNPESA
jgi:pimeloyl-ACP methyl ester carboxylesterase/DNA-binding CsgD family transcriptional regulator